jgi:hypothetical protein
MDWFRILIIFAGILAFFLVIIPANAEPELTLTPFHATYERSRNDNPRIASALAFAYDKQQDVLELTSASLHQPIDVAYHQEMLLYLRNLKADGSTARPEAAPFTAERYGQLLRQIKQARELQESVQSALGSKAIAWEEKKKALDEILAAYTAGGDALSSAPIDVVLRRTGVFFKPYFTSYRTHYPQSSSFMLAAQWWRPAMLEAQLLTQNGPRQESFQGETDCTFFSQVLERRPGRLLLMREVAPSFCRLSPAMCNISDNLHLLQGIVYDILSYKGWDMEQKKAELLRITQAMQPHAGDEKLVRKFRLAHKRVDPRMYYPWMKRSEGDITRIMEEMLEEVAAQLVPKKKERAAHLKALTGQMMMKLRPGLEKGEYEGSLYEALLQTTPQLKGTDGKNSGEPSPDSLIEVMAKGWKRKYATLPDLQVVSLGGTALKK